MKYLFLLLLAIPLSGQGQVNTPTSPRTAGTPVYHTAHYQQGGNIRVLRYKESGTVASQAQAGRLASPPVEEVGKGQPSHSPSRREGSREAQLVQFRLVSTPRYHFAQSTYRTQDNGTAVVLRVVSSSPPGEDLDGGVETLPSPSHREGSVKAYPNPVSTPGIITLEVPEGEGYTFRLLDLNGRVVHTEALPAATWSVQLEHLAPGVYVYTVENGTFRQSGRLVVG
ncbi:MAG: T9SS type A sorting domain-containing protein [Bacteroidetes bacterium]|nr:T9SS type A sorting domain-containing protein [Bacteroidota bacterium]